MDIIIKPSASIRQNYNQISELCKNTQSPVFLTKNGEGDLVVMDIKTYNQKMHRLELREKLLEIEENRLKGIQDQDAEEFILGLKGEFLGKKN